MTYATLVMRYVVMHTSMMILINNATVTEKVSITVIPNGICDYAKSNHVSMNYMWLCFNEYVYF